MFDDERSKRVVLVAHCVFNQNARIDKCGYFPGAMGEIAQVLTDSGIGILQMPCPELMHLGLDRQSHAGMEVGIRESLLEPEGRSACREMAQELVDQIHEYRKHDFEVIGVIGVDTSPACGVDITNYKGVGARPGVGGYITTLKEVFEENDLDLPMIGVNDADLDEHLQKVKDFLATAA